MGQPQTLCATCVSVPLSSPREFLPNIPPGQRRAGRGAGRGRPRAPLAGCGGPAGAGPGSAGPGWRAPSVGRPRSPQGAGLQQRQRQRGAAAARPERADIALPAGDRRPVGLNRVCVRPVPAWQRGISDFLKLPSKESRAPDGDTPGTSGLEARTLPLDPAEEGECSEEE
ncbi:PCNA-associated factor isoform X1 [Vidua macroura]|nr:PCNA-associated factor isoform X1 [Vidua macroura]